MLGHAASAAAGQRFEVIAEHWAAAACNLVRVVEAIALDGKRPQHRVLARLPVGRVRALGCAVQFRLRLGQVVGATRAHPRVGQRRAAVQHSVARRNAQRRIQIQRGAKTQLGDHGLGRAACLRYGRSVFSSVASRKRL